ncbi:outer membrane beta-barrel protein [Winogradskyella sp. SM1960]|uniref:outer membrane beta-barrel protein n=1 Tax=Winogradskyella sp. SM1960 TaxID=2865955 RepID=UPI001CD5B3A4|nr:outer membrane beta-barrel protein [Winogradskyella sp. SM1960]
MKKTHLLVTVSLIYLSSSIVLSAQSETKIGAFFAYGTEIENIGIGANAEFPIADKLTISPSFIYYLPKDESGIKINWFEINANANYYFLDEDSIGVYGFAGLNYSSIKVKYDDAFGFLGDFSSSDGRLGLNLGAGANFDIGSNITPFAELKYVIIDGGQLVIAAGVKFNL